MLPSSSDFVCCICKENLSSVSSLHYHQMNSHTTEELSLAILSVKDLQFEDMVRYPHFILNKINDTEHAIPMTENETDRSNTSNCPDLMLTCEVNSDRNISPNGSPSRITEIKAIISRLPNIITTEAHQISYVLPSPISLHHHSSVAYDYGKDGSFENIQCENKFSPYIALGTSEKETQTGIISVTTQRLAAFRKKKQAPSKDVAVMEERRFVCDLCKKSYMKKSHLERHMRIHTGVRPFECTYCKKTFTVGSILKQHIRTHTGEKPYTCNICQRQFPQMCGLRNHKLLHEKRPFKCDACNNIFVSNDELLLHLKSHSGSKKLACTTCAIEFYTIAALRQHAQTHVSKQ